MIKFKNRKGFSLLELIVAIIALSIISSLIYGTYVSMQEVDRKTTMVREMDSIKKTMKERLKNIDILEGTLISSENIYYGDEFAFEKDKFERFDDTDGKRKFWGVTNNQYKKYIYAQSKYFSNSNGEVPYTDFWVVMVGPKLDRIYNTPNDMLNEIFIFEEDKGLMTNFNLNYDADTSYPKAKAKGISKQVFREELKNIIIFKLSTQEIVLEKYNQTIEQINAYAKNLKDWGSIQMSMYENIIAKYGGSYNINYFVSLGFESSNDKGSPDYDFRKEMIYSSLALDSSDNPIRKSYELEQGFNKILEKNINSTNYGIVVCQNECTGEIKESEIVSMYGFEETMDNSTSYKLPKEAELTIQNAISLDSSYLLPGSKAIFGIGNPNLKIGNAFGEKYKFYLTNVKDWTLSWTDVENLNSGTISYSQNVPLNNSSVSTYAPYSASLFTVFPWFINDTMTKPLNTITDLPILSNGYYEVRVFPELR